MLDVERADRLEPIISEISKDTGITNFLVFDSQEGKGRWKGMKCFHTVVGCYTGDIVKVMEQDPAMIPEDNAAIMFTSGTKPSCKETLQHTGIH